MSRPHKFVHVGACSLAFVFVGSSWLDSLFVILNCCCFLFLVEVGVVVPVL